MHTVILNYITPPLPSTTLQELLKYTDKSHPDYDQVVSAQHAMKEVAMQINEQKRRMENIGKIGLWQMSIDSWKVCDMSEDIGETCFNIHCVGQYLRKGTISHKMLKF